MDIPLIAQIGTLIAAIAAFITSICSILYGKKSAKAALINSEAQEDRLMNAIQNRQDDLQLKRTDKIQEEVSIFLSSCASYFEDKCRSKGDLSDEDISRRIQLRDRIRLCEANVRFRIDPEDGLIRDFDSEICSGTSRKNFKCISYSHIKAKDVNNIDDKSEEGCNPYAIAKNELCNCMHNLTRIVNLKDIEGAIPEEKLAIMEEQFKRCYDGVTVFTKIILKCKWDEIKGQADKTNQ